mgnify:CR=1 FL=1
MKVALVPGIEGLKALEDHLLRGDAVVGRHLRRELAAVHSKVPGRQADLIIGIGQPFGRVLKVRIIAQRTKVLAAIVMVVLDNLLLLDRFSLFSSLFLMVLVCGLLTLPLVSRERLSCW